ncbi:MAG: M48 family metalloprotease, partial [Gammaproteobacteria bacterium]|nr:M48 family metalloprotease [Gammaproteobacteria bacterium]
RHLLLVPCVVAGLALGLAGCGTNPVTGKSEVQFVSESQELQIGAKEYAPTRQSQGGDLKVLPELTTYVSGVGQKLASVSDRQLPYEFVVLNSSVPNAWALPGGKIAVNRGLLTELDNEAELAAVLGHEIVHAAARHGAKAQERGTLLQVGMVAAQIGVAMSDVSSTAGNLMVQGAGVGAALVSTKYSREAELESDLYGMRYMQRAGYDPRGAVTLQEKFVRLAEAGSRNQNWLDGLFASHPPSRERVARNQATLAELGNPGGELGRERYAARVAPLLAMKPAYDKADQALALARRKDLSGAQKLAAEAARLVPKEARFSQLQGDIALAQKDPQAALAFYEKSIGLDDGYFASHLGAGTARYRLRTGDRGEAELTRSAKLLPTAPALYYLGMIAKEAGNRPRAMELFKGAAGSKSEPGRQAAVEYARLNFAENGTRYIASGLQLDARGQVVAVVENRAPFPVSQILLTPVLLDANGRIEQEGRQIRVNRTLQPGERASVNAGVGAVTDEVRSRLRVRVDSVRAE